MTSTKRLSESVMSRYRAYIQNVATYSDAEKILQNFVVWCEPGFFCWMVYLLPHHARYATRLVVWRPHVVLQEAPRFRTEVAGSHIGPGAALGFGIAGHLAGFTYGIRRHIEIAVIAAGTINGKFPHAMTRLDHTGAADTGCGGAVFHPGRHLALEPAHPRAIGGRVIEAPGPAAGLPVTPGSACTRIAGPHRKIRIITTTAIEPYLCARLRREAKDSGNS